MTMTVAEMLALAPVVPVLVIRRVEDAVPLARALVAGGLPLLEITLRTAAALPAIRAIADAVPDAIVGAGTLIEPDQVDAVCAAGGRFLVSPGSTPALLDRAEQLGVPMLPGAATPTEMMALLARGYRSQKLFPASAVGGAALLKAIASPLPGITFCPTGGITLQTAPDYLALPNVACVGGSWVAPDDRVAAGDWSGIELLARQAAALPRR
jgi:2-dehydro-3-deoxyphosphogluconate aldolase / (4S)-4-hydroxy-2-oxoglutarate aldolase